VTELLALYAQSSIGGRLRHLTRFSENKASLPLRDFLVFSDASELRTQEWQAYQKHSKKLESSSQSLKSFQSEELPQYQQWLETHFGGTVGRFRQTVVQIQQAEDFLNQVQTYSALKGLSVSNAFKILTEAQRGGTLQELWQELHDEQCKLKGGAARFSGNEDRFDSVFEDIFGSVPDKNDSSEESERLGSCAGSGRQKNADVCAASLKAVYHKLALKLHPDHNAQLSEEHKALFQTVQSLYKFQDLESLEALWLKLQTGPAHFFDWKTAPISEIMNRRRSVERRLKNVSQGLKSARVHPAWGFNKKNKSSYLLSQLSRTTKSQLESDLRSAIYHLGLIQNQLQKLENKSQKTPRKSVKNRR
jgi:hypothetical protein